MKAIFAILVACLLLVGCQPRRAIELAREADKTDDPIGYVMSLDESDRMKLMIISETENKPPDELYEGWEQSMATAKGMARRYATKGTDEEVRQVILTLRGHQ